VLGGVTDQILSDAGLPVLLSHWLLFERSPKAGSWPRFFQSVRLYKRIG
jgi:hypothetical protein